MITCKFMKTAKHPDSKKLNAVCACEVIDDATRKGVELFLPLFDAVVLNKLLTENISGTEWKYESGGDEAVTALFMMAPDDAIWGPTRNTLIYLSLAGERSLLDLLYEVTAEDSPFTTEEYALCFWAQAVLDTLSNLKARGLTNEEIIASQDLRALFN
ncbi:MAG: hypothetical protein GX451_03540 [Acholeplasmataceae bacterium]|nr:hypothetical protein [Acholeplasmataceae bacterium]